MSGRKTTPVLLDRGTLIAGRYRIDHCLAWGGMGVVYAASHVDLGHRVALKFLRPDLASDSEAIERFLDEARMAAGFRSQYVAHVLDYGHHEHVPYLVAEYLEGVDLWTVLDERGPLPMSDVADWIAEACAGLAEVHASGIVHRDLKPENLFLSTFANGPTHIKLLDFGVSKRVGTGRCLTKPKKGVGSPLYMSPEQMRGQPIDARADVWALGTVLYELLTGHLPFDADNVADICNRVLRSAPISPHHYRRDLPSDLVDVILRCLEKDRARRYADVAELAAALAPFGRRDALLAAEEAAHILHRDLLSIGPSRKRRRVTASHRLVVGLAALAGLATAAALEMPQRTALASMEATPLTPPERALRSWVETPELRFANAVALPEVSRPGQRVYRAMRRAAPIVPTAVAETQAVAHTETEPGSTQCPLPESEPPSPELPDTPTLQSAPPAAPLEPARPPPPGAWQI